MKTKDIYLKTMKFVWLKLALGLAIFLLSMVLLGIVVGIMYIFKNTVVSVMLLLFWLFIVRIMITIVHSYVGYFIKAGHVAIIQRAVTTGTVPDNQFQVGKEMVQSRFATSNVYFVVDKLISGSVRQLQNGMDQVDNMLGNIPILSSLIGFAKIFIGIALGYVDECCLGYTFHKEEEGAFKGACDGVVIYFQSWKILMKTALITTLQVIGISVVIWLGCMIFVGSLFAALGWNMLLAFFVAVFTTSILKSAFVDSYMMIKMMVSYMEVAPSAEISLNLYEKLSGLSRKFKELFDKSTKENTKVIENKL